MELVFLFKLLNCRQISICGAKVCNFEQFEISRITYTARQMGEHCSHQSLGTGVLPFSGLSVFWVLANRIGRLARFREGSLFAGEFRQPRVLNR
jgi:hypothetical protein